MIKNKFVFFAALSSMLCTLYSATAVAQPVQAWSMNAMACQPSQETIEKNIMAQVWGQVKFQKNKTGKIVLFCPVSTNPQSQNHTVRQLSLTFLENNGQKAVASVSAALRYVSKEGNSPPVTVVEINTDSPNTPNSGPFFITKIKPQVELPPPLQPGIPNWGLNHALNLYKNFYYIQITIERTLPSQSISVKGVSLTFDFI